jgi:O-antigen ligase
MLEELPVRVRRMKEAALVVFLLSIGVAIVIAIPSGVEPHQLPRKALPFLILLIYFPLVSLAREPRCRVAILLAVAAVVVVAALRTLVEYREALASVTKLWQVIAARRPHTEPVFLAGLAVGFGVLTQSLGWWRRSLLLLFVVIASASLAVTFSRGYWIAAAIACSTVLWGISRKARIRIAWYFAAVALVGAVATSVFFGNWARVVVEQVGTRAASLQFVATDASAVERVVESRAVIERILVNPIAGYGLGAQFEFQSVVGRPMPTEYVHNAYLALWFQLGLPALVAFLAFYVGTIADAHREIRSGVSGVEGGLMLGILGLLLAMLPLSISSPQFTQKNSLFLITVAAALVTAARESRESEARASGG